MKVLTSIYIKSTKANIKPKTYKYINDLYRSLINPRLVYLKETYKCINMKYIIAVYSTYFLLVKNDEK